MYIVGGQRGRENIGRERPSMQLRVRYGVLKAIMEGGASFVIRNLNRSGRAQTARALVSWVEVL